MLKYNKVALYKQAKDAIFNRNTFEKVARLKDILKVINDSPYQDILALKGGTAINLLFHDLPRLSVDIDFDFTMNCSRDEMLSMRATIHSFITQFMEENGYVLNKNSKDHFSLDSLVFDYMNVANSKDKIKIEINYSERAHILPIQREKIKTNIFKDDFLITCLSPIEIYASKTVALLTRAMPRDLYDMNYFIQHHLFHSDEMELLRKCVIFYLAVGTDETPTSITTDEINRITKHAIFAHLTPVSIAMNSLI